MCDHMIGGLFFPYSWPFFFFFQLHKKNKVLFKNSRRELDIFSIAFFASSYVDREICSVHVRFAF